MRTTSESNHVSCQAFLQKKHSRILGTQIVEDAFNRQKRRKASHMNRRLKVAAAWDVLQERHLVDHVHHYTPVVSHVPLRDRLAVLDKGIFQGPMQGTSMSFEGVASYKAQVDWYSPKADRHGVQYADVQLTRYAVRRGLLGKVKDKWLNVFVQGKHHILLREVLDSEKKEYGPILFACTHLKGSVGFGWPAVQYEVPGHPGEVCFVPAAQATADEVPVVILDLACWEAMQFEWHSPAWQFARFTSARGRWTHQIRAFPRKPGSGFQPLMQVACEAGFWEFNNELVRRLASHCDIEIAEDRSLFSTCLATIKGVTQCSDAEAVDMLQVTGTGSKPKSQAPHKAAARQQEQQ